MTDAELVAQAVGSARVIDLARLLGVSRETIHAWRSGGTVPAVKRRWLERWTRSHPDTQRALLFWADPDNFPRTPGGAA